MRLLLYNIRYAVGSGASMHVPLPGAGYLLGNQNVLPDITQFIMSTDPDIVGLIEVDTGSIRSRKVNQAEKIATDLGMSSSYEVKYSENSLNQMVPIVRKQGNAFLAAQRVHGETFHYFDTGIKRLIIELEMESFAVFLVHLSLKYRHRHLQLRKLFDLIDATEKTGYRLWRLQYLLGRERDLPFHARRRTAQCQYQEHSHLSEPLAQERTRLHPVPGRYLGHRFPGAQGTLVRSPATDLRFRSRLGHTEQQNSAAEIVMTEERPPEYEDWQLERDEQGVVWLSLDKAGSNANVLSRTVLQQLADILATLERGSPRGLVLFSKKRSGFVMGADINEFTTIQSTNEAVELVRAGQKIMDRLANLQCPTVAVINGYALGGGLELAMACDYRVALQSEQKILGLPEVQLGLHPGFGGTIRAVEYCGVRNAMKLMLTGKPINVARGLQQGLIDAVTSEEKWKDVAGDLIGRRPARSRAPLLDRILGMAPLRPLIAKGPAQAGGEQSAQGPLPCSLCHGGSVAAARRQGQCGL